MSGEIREGKGLFALLLGVIGSPKAGLELVEVAAELVAENARFNKWVFARKSRSSSIDLWNLAALARRHEEDLSAAWNGYQLAGDELRNQRFRELINLLNAQRDSLRECREYDSVAYQDPAMPRELLD
ncbi:hypothetical protein [Micromonospora sp. WMMD1082]|uniref:hypothetical protein n=1 Tax=Micromonospora sp. WMMD1082 TaxID=3016104 RepID=UPI002415C4ED|nr:hypothetical protein [Micromonospora sp. WMMD1082]MDG4792896.1 hypothetical protein [Micromonospora sp. WMMD1082]